MRSRLRTVYRALGWVGLVFLLLLAMQIIAGQIGFSRGAAGLRVAVYLAGTLLALRLTRLAYRRGIWRLRNRLLAAYLFMAVVPILLIGTLAIVGIRAASSQLAVYLVTSELDRRIEGLQLLGESLALEPTAARKIDNISRNRYPGIAVLLRDAGKESRYPQDAELPAPSEAWANTSGVVQRQGQFYLWSHRKTPAGDVTVTAPLTREFLSGLAPDIGQVGFGKRGRPRKVFPPCRYRIAVEHGRGCPGELDVIDIERRLRPSNGIGEMESIHVGWVPEIGP